LKLEDNMGQSLEDRVIQLEEDLGRVALLTEALMEAILKKGVLSQIEIAQMMTEVDLSDGERDGKLDLARLRQRRSGPMAGSSPDQPSA
jgi:hypothetical protein